MTHSDAIASKLDRPEILASIFYPRSEPRPPLPDNAVDLDIAVPESSIVLG
jgi:hypothetical protein